MNEKIPAHLMGLQTRWNQIQLSVTDYERTTNRKITILAATKYGDAEDAATLIRCGATLIGENRISDAEPRLSILRNMALPRFEAHFIGTLQRNKIRRALDLFSCIQSMDRDPLFDAIQSECARQNRTINAMIQINTGNEAAKSGYTISKVTERHRELFAFPNIKIIGIMAVTPFFSNPEEVRPLFKSVSHLFTDLQSLYPNLLHLSMGMSHDYGIAIQEGATMIRIGSALYGR